MSLNLFIFFVFIFSTAGVLSAIIEGTTSLATTDLTADLTESATSMSVSRTQGFPTNGVLVVSAELICYTAVTATTFTDLTRGETCRRSSKASTHQSGDRVYSEAPGVINTLIGFNIASAFSEGGIIGAFKGTIETVRNIPGFINAAANMITWDYSYLVGPYVYIKYFLLWPLSAMFVLGMVKMALGR